MDKVVLAEAEACQTMSREKPVVFFDEFLLTPVPLQAVFREKHSPRRRKDIGILH
jgi:hypothetical protein